MPHVTWELPLPELEDKKPYEVVREAYRAMQQDKGCCAFTVQYEDGRRFTVDLITKETERADLPYDFRPMKCVEVSVSHITQGDFAKLADFDSEVSGHWGTAGSGVAMLVSTGDESYDAEWAEHGMSTQFIRLMLEARALRFEYVMFDRDA